MKTIAVTLALLTALAWGQSMTSQKTVSTWNTPTLESSFNHCLVSNENQNCWIKTSGTGVVPAPYVNNTFGKTFAIDSSHEGFIYNDVGSSNVGTWTAHPEWGSVYALVQGINGILYGLYGTCAGGGHNLGQWTGKAWTLLSYCYNQLSLSADNKGLILLLDENGCVWGAPNYGSSGFSHYPMPHACGGALSVAATMSGSASGSGYYLVLSDNTIWLCQAGGCGQMPGKGTQIASGNLINPYMVGMDGKVYHWNGTGWDGLVTPETVQSLSVGSNVDVWISGTGEYLYRFWENGILLSHSYGGSVSCGQGVPQAECQTFTHTVKHQICVGGHCGPVSTSSWSGSGSWGPNAQVFATPYDLWTCLLAGEPTGPCGLAENEASMECSGGGSNQDNAPDTNYIVADSIDVHDFSENLDDKGPMNAGGAYSGYVLGEVENDTTENCWPQDPIPVCPQPSGLTINEKVDWWGGPVQQNEALILWNQMHNQDMTGESAPYVIHSFFWAILNPDGTIYTPSAICFGGWLGSKDFLYGNYEARPHCK